MALEPLRAGDETALLDLVAKVQSGYDGSLEEAKSAVLEAVQASKDKGSKKAEACALLALFSIRSAQGEPLSDTLKDASDAIKLFKEVGDQAKAGEAQMALSKAYSSKPEDSLRWAKEAVSTFAAAKLKAQLVKALFLQATANLEMKLYEAAAKAAKDAAATSKEVKDKASEAYSTYLIAAAQLGNKDTKEALETAKEAVSLAKSAGAPNAQAAAMQIYAETLLLTGSMDEAKKTALEALGLVTDDDGDRKAEASLMLVLGKANMSDAPVAAQYAEQAMSLFLLLGDAKNEMAAAQTAASANLALKKYDEALTLAMQGVVMANELGDKVAEAKCLQMASEARMGKGRPGEALLAARKAGEIYKSLKDRPSVRDVDKAIIKIEEKMPPPHRPTNILQFPSPGGGGAIPTSLATAPNNCIIWNSSVKEGCYTNYCLELLKMVDDITKSKTNCPLVICSRGAYGRMYGQDCPGSLSHCQSGSIWGVVRTIRLEQPRMKCMTVDIAPDMDGREIAKVLCDAAEDSGPRDEVAYTKVLDPEKTREKYKPSEAGA